MIKRFWIVCLIFTICEIGRTQDEKAVKVSQLKSELSHLKDTPRINCLNAIASLFSFSNVYHDFDSVARYAVPALKESRSLGYKKGLIASLFSLGNAETRTNSEDGERHFKELIRLAGDDSIISYALLRLGQCLSNEAKYEEAIATLTTCAERYGRQNKMGKVANALGLIGHSYLMKGDYERAFEYIQDALQRSRSINDPALLIPPSLYMADLFMSVEDYASAKKYINDAWLWVTPAMIPVKNDTMVPRWIGRTCLTHRGDLYFHLGNYDSAFYYYDRASYGYTDPVYKMKLASIYLARKQYDRALPLLAFSRQRAGQVHDMVSFMQSLLGLGEVYLHKKNFGTAHRFAMQALELAREKGNMKVMQEAYQLLVTVHEMTGKTGEALTYHKEYMRIRDSVINNQYKWKLFAFRQAAETDRKLAVVQLLKKQNEISDQKLVTQQRELAKSRLIKNILWGAIILFGLLSYFFFHYVSLKRKNERLRSTQVQAELKHRASELEMQALRSQMNPHFIFNCLSSINRFILKNETETASNYLTRFSRLIRMVLIHSQSSMILLKEELEMLRHYLELEQMRFRDAFDYDIIFENSFDPGTILIPPLLLQPFCENAIRHGLMYKEAKGQLVIKLGRQDDLLHCEITDNGIGRKKAAELKEQSGISQTPLGLKMTRERLALINENRGNCATYEIEDIVENGKVAGTKVTLYIRYEEQARVKDNELSYSP